MADQYSRTTIRKALEKSLEPLGEPSKKSLLLYLEKEYHLALADEPASLEVIESALKSILGRGAFIVTDELHKILESSPRTSKKKMPTRRQVKKTA